jgi:hypothetical protein
LAKPPAAIRDQLMRLCSSNSGSMVAIEMWRNLMTKDDRWWLRNDVDKEPYDPNFDEIEGDNLPSDELEMKEGLPGRAVRRNWTSNWRAS